MQVPAIEEAPRSAVELGAAVEVPVTQAGSVVIAIFRDPAGNRIGLVRG